MGCISTTISLIPANIFRPCGVGLPAGSDGRGGHLITSSGPLAVMRRVSTEEASCHYPASNTGLEADPVPLESANWELEVGCWWQKPVKQNISRHRGGQEDKRVGSVEACCRQSTGSRPPLSLLSYPLAHLCAY